MALKKNTFGEEHSKEFEIGDIVEWTTWDTQFEIWKQHYGVLISIQNEFRSNRLVSISKVMPLHGSEGEREFFTLSLRKISAVENTENDS